MTPYPKVPPPLPEPTEKYMGELPMPDAEIAQESCTKCGAGEPMIRFHQDARKSNGCGYYAKARCYTPHLHLTCRTCHFEWTTATLDAGDA